ncbi:MAG: NADH:flavin oxidoreductase/NADH oxidase [Ectothiorhodospiraceae bacterium]|nr:NADH:flavin oxidoreductase/NADH oxidase [Chromatiales bacterium]MCP5154079.1 NADH:flavin oxidoreductase/NADH oxidase [Ectothiorhodospiraceae bacterium]
MSGSSRLFSPFSLRGVTFPNRIVVSPMQMYLAPDAVATDWHFQHLAKYAVGGAGCVFGEVLCVEPRGRNTHWDLGIWDDAQVPPLARIAAFLREAGAVPAAQIGHCGAKASRQRPFDGHGPLGPDDAARGEPPWTPLGPTDDPAAEGYLVPHALTAAEIATIVDQFAAGTRRIDAAGYDFLEVHAAHGYLIHSFYSPISNRRTDGYGGDRRGRMRLALEIAEAVRGNWPDDKPLSYRLSCVDGMEGGWTIEDTVALARELRARGVDTIDCSSRGVRGATSLANLEASRRPAVAGYQVPYAEHVRRETGIPTMAVGLILTPRQAERILEREQADLVLLAREALVDPHWALRAARELEPDAGWQRWPPSWAWWLAQRERTGIEYPDGWE